MRELLDYVAKGLVSEPDAVRIEERDGVFELSVAQGDLGKVIGRQGRTAKALRTVLAAMGEVQGKPATLEILD